MEIDRGRGLPDNNEPRDRRDASPHTENPKQKAPEAGALPLGLPIPEPEQPKSQEGRAEGKQSLQGPTTFDGHAEYEWRFNEYAFMRRSLEAMKALREKMGAKALGESYRQDYPAGESYVVEETGRVAFNDIYRSVFEYHVDNREDKPEYERGLQDAFNLIIAHLRGHREPYVPKKSEK